MVTQERVLKFIVGQTEQGRSTSFEALAGEFGLSPEAACDHLKRLWRERLVETVLFRPKRFRFRLQPGESIRQLRFRLAPRGQERLEWYERQEEKDQGLLWFR